MVSCTEIICFVNGMVLALWHLICVKTLVWFWLIDETLSANLVYQSDYEICSTIPSGEANKDHDMMMVMRW